MAAKFGVVLAALLVGCTPATAQAPDSTGGGPDRAESQAGDRSGAEERRQQPTRDLTDRVYTVEQARRGEAVAQQECIACHTTGEWTSPAFLNLWIGGPVRTLYDRMRLTMPPHAPESLTPQQYADIIGYILWINGAPAGEVELTGDPETLGDILMAAPSTP